MISSTNEQSIRGEISPEPACRSASEIPRAFESEFCLTMDQSIGQEVSYSIL